MSKAVNFISATNLALPSLSAAVAIMPTPTTAEIPGTPIKEPGYSIGGISDSAQCLDRAVREVRATWRESLADPVEFVAPTPRKTFTLLRGPEELDVEIDIDLPVRPAKLIHQTTAVVGRISRVQNLISLDGDSYWSD